MAEAQVRIARGRGTHRPAVAMSLSKACMWVFGLSLGACDGRAAELREWTPADHQPPPAVAPEGQGEGAASEDPKRAVLALWSLRCATCHGSEGHGDGPGRPPGIALPDLARPDFQAQRSDAQLVEVIARGRGMMPAFGQEIPESGILALVQHIRGLQAQR